MEPKDRLRREQRRDSSHASDRYHDSAVGFLKTKLEKQKKIINSSELSKYSTPSVKITDMMKTTSIDDRSLIKKAGAMGAGFGHECIQQSFRDPL